MHASKVGHFDLKPDHILLDMSTSELDKCKQVDQSWTASVDYILSEDDFTGDIVVIDYDRSKVTYPDEHVHYQEGTNGKFVRTGI